MKLKLVNSTRTRAAAGTWVINYPNIFHYPSPYMKPTQRCNYNTIIQP